MPAYRETKFDLTAAYLKETGKIELFNNESEIAAFQKFEEISASIIEELEKIPEAKYLIGESLRLLYLDSNALRAEIGDNAFSSKEVRAVAETKARIIFEALESVNSAIDAAILADDKIKIQVNRKLKLNILLDSDFGTRRLNEALALPAAKKHVMLKARLEQTRNKIAEANLRLVTYAAKRYRPQGLELLDLLQEGNIGLMRAIQRFEWRRGFKFSTYAIWWIKQSIKRYISDSKLTVRIPIHQHEVIARVLKEINRHELLFGFAPEIQNLESAKGINIENLMTALLASKPGPSLDQPLNPDDFESPFIDSFADESIQPADEMHQAKQSVKSIERFLISVLTPREQKIISLRFGLAGKEALTLDVVGESMGLTRERIRQIEQGALLKLQKAASQRDFQIMSV